MTQTAPITARAGEIPAAFPAKARRLPPDWSAADDNRLRDTKGKYARIAALSDRRGVETGALQARWHLLRAGAVPAPNSEGPEPEDWPVPFATLRQRVTVSLRGVLDALQSGRPLTYQQIYEETGRYMQQVQHAITRNRARMAGAGWLIRTARSDRKTRLTLERIE